MNAVAERDAALQHGDAEWERLRDALDARLDQPLCDGTDWTGHDVFAHFARWQELTIATVRTLLAGQRPPAAEADEDTLNTRWRAEDRGLPAAEVRERCLRSRQELRDLLSGLSDDQWRLFGQAAAADINGEHYAHHMRDAGMEPAS